MNSVTAHRPLRDTAEAVSLRYRCSAPPSPRHHAFCFDLAGVFSFFILYGGGGRGRVSPKEKLAEFKCGLGFAKLFSGDFDLAKPRLIYFGGNSDLVSRAEEGSGEESARASLSDFDGAKFKI